MCVRQDSQVGTSLVRFQVRFPVWPLWCCCLFLEYETLRTLLQSTKCGLVSTGEAAHLAVTFMGTWYKLGKWCQLSMSCIVGEDPGGTSGAQILTCETWYSLLCVRICQRWLLGRCDCSAAAKRFCFFALLLCMYVFASACVCYIVCVSHACLCITCIHTAQCVHSHTLPMLKKLACNKNYHCHST